jgi:TRAP-type C4-dicarboxylate transport system permease small subunit
LSAWPKAGRIAFVALPNAILGALMLVAVAINVANVVSRYAFGEALFWAEETLSYIVIWGVFLGLAAIAYNGDHLSMDLISARARGRGRLLLNAAVAATLLLACGFVFHQTGQVSVAAGWPKAVPHAALLVGFGLAALAVVVRIRAYVTGKF